MTKEGWFYSSAAALLALALLVYVLGTVLLWIGLGLALVGLVILVWYVWGVVHRRRIETRINRAEARRVEAKANQEQAIVEQQQALAERMRWEAEQARAQVRMVPATMVGLLLETPEERERLVTWAQPRKVIYNNTVEAPALPAPATAQLPQAHVWEVIEPEVGPNHFYLGATADEMGRSAALWVPLDGIITLVSIGPQGLGKTTLARSLALQQLMQGGDLAICDWYNDIAAEMGRYFAHCYSEPDDCERYVTVSLVPEMEQRHAAYKQGQRDFPTLLWLIDEWAMLKKDCPAMAEALVNAFTVWRKLGLRVVVSSVALDTRDLGVSKSAVSTLALFSGNENLARTWGLSGIRGQLDMLYKSGKGYCLITSQHLQRQAELLALPHVSAPLFASVIHRTRRDLYDRSVAFADVPQLPALPVKREAGGTPGSSRILPFPRSPESPAAPKGGILSQREREYIAARYRDGVLRTAIRDELRAQRKDGFSNRHWAELAAICDTIDAETKEEEA